MADPVRVIALLRTQPGKAADQVAAFAKVAPVVRAEDGCLQYDLHPVLDDPDRFVVVERWDSRAALAAHAASDHMRAAGQTSGSFRDGPAEVIVISDEPVA
jgi:quinol monooxygenase YgiN